MRKILLAVLLVGVGATGVAFADGEWIRESPVWFKKAVYTGTSKIALTNTTGNLSTTTGAFSSTLSVTGASTLTGAVSAGGALAVSGATTLASTLKMTDATTVGAAGTTGGSATALSHAVNGVTGATNAGVILPATAGFSAMVSNQAGVAIKLWPPIGGQINQLGADTAVSMAANKSYWCMAASASAYYCAGN